MPVDVILENDLKWREAELASLKKHVVLADAGSVAQRGLLRALWAMLYAHYEGFTKFCWDTFLDEIQSSSIRIDELSEPFALLSLEKDFKALRGSLDSLSLWDFSTSNLPARLRSSASFPEESRLQTDSNLWPNVFERENWRIGISCSQLNAHRSMLKSLVSRRNEIAHGKDLSIRDLTEYQPYENAALSVMHELALSILHAVENKTYISSG